MNKKQILHWFNCSTSYGTNMENMYNHLLFIKIMQKGESEFKRVRLLFPNINIICDICITNWHKTRHLQNEIE